LPERAVLVHFTEFLLGREKLFWEFLLLEETSHSTKEPIDPISTLDYVVRMNGFSIFSKRDFVDTRNTRVIHPTERPTHHQRREKKPNKELGSGNVEKTQTSRSLVLAISSSLKIANIRTRAY
jgi:hypothetical protein